MGLSVRWFALKILVVEHDDWPLLGFNKIDEIRSTPPWENQRLFSR